MKLQKVPYATALEILSLYEVNTAFYSLVMEQMTPLELLELALKHEYYADIVTFLAYGLPVRESVLWAANCADSCPNWSVHERDAIRAAKAWVFNPNESSRRFAEQMAGKAQLVSGAGWVAQAAFWSGGSITRPGDPSVSPPPYLYAQAVAGSINLSAILPAGESTKQRYLTFIEIGLHISRGGNGLI